MTAPVPVVCGHPFHSTDFGSRPCAQPGHICGVETPCEVYPDAADWVAAVLADEPEESAER